MKSITHALTTMIIYSTIVFLSVFMALYMTYTSLQSVSSTEYFYIRQAFQSVSLNIPIIINPMGGGTYAISYPALRMGIGWREQGNIQVYINGTLSLSLSCKSIYSKIDKPIITSRHNVYGVNNIIVNDTRLLPRVVEYYENGSTYIVLDTCRFLYQVDRVASYGKTTYYVRLFYVNLIPHIQTKYGNKAHIIKLYVQESPTVKNYENVYGLLIRFNYDDEVYEISPGDLGVSPPIELTIIIYNVGVEVG